jgi:hypothetical protein
VITFRFLSSILSRKDDEKRTNKQKQKAYMYILIQSEEEEKARFNLICNQLNDEICKKKYVENQILYR